VIGFTAAESPWTALASNRSQTSTGRTIRILVLFLIYVTASEFSHLFGPGELPRLFFTSRPSELQLNRRQRTPELLRLSRQMDAHSIDEFGDTTRTAHRELIEILQPLARK